MEKAFEAYTVIRAMAVEGNPNSVTDAGVGAMAIRSCIKGAYFNVRINLKDLEDKEFATDLLAKAKELDTRSDKAEREILDLIEPRL
jgi:glutamate formiminotransferase/formiminotetrahydrofolate cyclodeaminase